MVAQLTYYYITSGKRVPHSLSRYKFLALDATLLHSGPVNKKIVLKSPLKTVSEPRELDPRSWVLTGQTET